LVAIVLFLNKDYFFKLVLVKIHKTQQFHKSLAHNRLEFILSQGYQYFAPTGLARELAQKY